MNIKLEKENLKEKAGKHLNEMFAEKGDKPLLFLLSGGSSLELLNFVDEKSLKGNTTIGMLDDRYSDDRNVNSFLMLQGDEFASGFYTKALQSGAVFLDSHPEEHESWNYTL
jgi:hypothetical protein